MTFAVLDRRRCLTGLMICIGLVIAGLLSPAHAVSAAPARSDPVWLPVHSSFGLDCAGENPGCSAHRRFFSIDVIPSGQFDGHPSHAKVYAMGGGTVHIGDAHGSRCGASSTGSFGTWMWIDHGHGIKSRYGHLSRILVKNGARVSAGTPIGVVGVTGKANNCRVNYLDFEIYHGALKTANAHRFNTLRACTPAGKQQTWPAQAASTKAFGNTRRVHFTTWQQVPHGTQFPASSGRCIPAG